MASGNSAKALINTFYPSVKTDGNEFNIAFNSLPSLLRDWSVNKAVRALAKIW
jgi:hypothetical protein